MYYDADLYEFVKRSYPEYLTLYESLKGVYMADMARVLVIYHYGGIYMDLDFYCYRYIPSLVASSIKFEIDENDH
jgi:inositol phosphorylceramide mannosyltransferase catalytic subunit